MPLNTIYQSPPNSGGNDGALPAIYVQNWQFFTNLTPAQILAFQSFPQDLTKYAAMRRWQAEVLANLPVTVTLQGTPTVLQIDMTDRGQSRIDKLARKGATVTATVMFLDATGTMFQLGIPAIAAIDMAVANFIEQLFTTLNTIVAGINAAPATITTRKQIDAAIAVVAPNSPSATQPSLT